MKKCNKSCPACPFILKTKTVLGSDFKWSIVKSVGCNTKKVIYMIEGVKDRCKARYIGETGRELRKRLSDHKGYVKNDKSQPTGNHFNMPGHHLEHIKITVLEKVRKIYILYRKEI